VILGTLFEHAILNLLVQSVLHTKIAMHSGHAFIHDKRFLKSYKTKILYFAPYLAPKWPAPLFEHIWIPIPQECFLPTLVEIDLVVTDRWKTLCLADVHKINIPSPVQHFWKFTCIEIYQISQCSKNWTCDWESSAQHL